MNMENSKTSEPHKFVLNLSQRLDLKTYLFITRGKMQEISIKTMNEK